MPSQPATTSGDSPIDDFSQCHVGIVSHLQQLGRLPALLEPAAQARRIAADTVSFFREVVLEHHALEERDLFPAVLANATPGDERGNAQRLVERLCAEHRQIEATWRALEPSLKEVAAGRDADLDGSTVQALVAAYLAHAGYEEQVFLPLSRTILGRDSNQMAALGLSLHLRHSLPALLGRYGHRI